MKDGMSIAALGALLRGDNKNALIAMTPGGIEQQEAEGQRDFVANTTLPIKCSGCVREQFEKMGIVFGEEVDDLFIAAELPEGWKKAATGHSMWSELVDPRGGVRAQIFYKAAFYDRDAFLNIHRRFSVGIDYTKEGDYDPDTERRAQVRDMRQGVRWQSETLTAEEGQSVYDLDSDSLTKQAGAWLDKNYPDWRDPMAYWD